MTYQETFRKISETINNKIVLNDYIFKNLNWVHAIRVVIFGLEYTKYTNNYVEGRNEEKDNLVSGTPKPSIAQNIIKRINELLIYSKIKSFFKRIRSVTTFVNYALTLIKFYFYARYLRIINRNNIINFYHDNYDVKYGKSYFNPYSDNINIKENPVKLCFLQLGKKKELKKALYKPYIINTLRLSHIRLFTNRINLNTDFLNPLKEVLDEETLFYLKNNISVVYKNYLFFTYVLKVLKPERVYIDESYNIFALGLIAAAKGIGVQTIEQQHGVIYPLHLGYCYNYNNLSQTDFVCDQLNYYTKLSIDLTKTGWTFHPKLVEIPASPAFQIWSKFKDSEKNENLQKLKTKVSGFKVVTFGLGNELLPDWLVKSIITLNNSYFFCFRLHPRYSYVNRPQIIEMQKIKTNIDFEYSSSIPLFDLCEISNFFLSDGSTTLIDSLQFNLYAICFSESFSIEIFRPYIEKKIVLPALNETEFKNIMLYQPKEKINLVSRKITE